MFNNLASLFTGSIVIGLGFGIGFFTAIILFSLITAISGEYQKWRK